MQKVIKLKDRYYNLKNLKIRLIKVKCIYLDLILSVADYGYKTFGKFDGIVKLADPIDLCKPLNKIYDKVEILLGKRGDCPFTTQSHNA